MPWSGDGGNFTIYRWQTPDPIPFRTGIRVSWENSGYDGVSFGEKTYYPSSVAFWYQQHPPGAGVRGSQRYQ